MKIVSKAIGLLLLITLFGNLSFAQVTLVVESVPANTPANDKIYFAGSIQGWNPGHPDWTLAKGNDGKYSITIPEGVGEVLYKFTRGSWETVEGGPNGETIPNRKFMFTGQPQTIGVTILSWQAPPPSTAASNVQILNNNFDMPQLGRTRRIWLYLPPDYNTTTKQYPVLYMHDAQNLFDTRTSFSGEWEVDETLNRLHAAGDYGAIVVGIDNGGDQRLNEYSPWLNPAFGGGQGDAYVDFLALTLKPYIDANYRTMAGPQQNALIGSSMGGLISLYGSLKYPQVFGKVGSLSPAYWFALANLNAYISSNTNDITGLRIQHTTGEKEAAHMTPNAQVVRTNLSTKGFQPANDQHTVDPEGTHTEAFWRSRFGEAYQWLFPPTVLPVSMGPVSATRNKDCSVGLQWQVFSAQKHKGFDIEESTDGSVFVPKAKITAANSRRYPQTWQHNISQPTNGTMYLRLKQNDVDGQFTYSEIVKVPACQTTTMLRVLPNPVQNSFRVVQHQFQQKDFITLVSADGKVLRNWKAVANFDYPINDLPGGTYFIGLNNRVVGTIIKN